MIELCHECNQYHTIRAFGAQLDEQTWDEDQSPLKQKRKKSVTIYSESLVLPKSEKHKFSYILELMQLNFYVMKMFKVLFVASMVIP